ncbi:MAG TPA: hypothetical protein VE487_03130 [Ilumatobacter sp.]|jgi:hypothetical protein|nr:hypothetical protein [Ilumatobacter sp.]
MMAKKQAPTLSDDQIMEVLPLIKGADSVELKLTVPDADRRSAVAALGMDALDAQMRQVMFFDTPDLALNQIGVVVRGRRIQNSLGDTVVKLRPVVPNELPGRIRKSPSFGVEVDAMPGGFVCSGSMKSEVDAVRAKDTFAGVRPIAKLFSKEQRAFYEEHAPGGIEMNSLSRLGPINVLKLKFIPDEFRRKLVAELWFYPDGSRILELSTKCAPAEAFDVAAETKAFLAGRGIDLAGEQQTKTRTALEFFASELQAAQAVNA